MNYTKATLKGTLEAVLNDIKDIEYQGEKVYPEYPDNYEVTGDTVHDRFIVPPPKQEVLTAGEFNEEGEELTPPVMGEYISYLVLPAGYDISHLKTAVND